MRMIENLRFHGVILLIVADLYIASKYEYFHMCSHRYACMHMRTHLSDESDVVDACNIIRIVGSDNNHAVAVTRFLKKKNRNTSKIGM